MWRGYFSFPRCSWCRWEHKTSFYDIWFEHWIVYVVRRSWCQCPTNLSMTSCFTFLRCCDHIESTEKIVLISHQIRNWTLTITCTFFDPIFEVTIIWVKVSYVLLLPLTTLLPLLLASYYFVSYLLPPSFSPHSSYLSLIRPYRWQ